jgi:hypothetical protein
VCVAVAVPMVVSASGSAPAEGHTASPLAAPSVDGDYLYGQLYAMAKAFSYRISGADGEPRSASDPFNLPPTVNGWQELFAY